MTHNLSAAVAVYKPVGKTPLECVTKYRSLHRIDSTVSISYAGRLDPMAEGVLLLLVGDENKKRREYEHLSKEYEVIVLVGFATDTGDLMGKIIRTSDQSQIMNMRKQLGEVLSSFFGSVEQKYPAYSSAKVQGKPLYWWARQGRLNEIEIPTHKVQIESIEIISSDNSILKGTSSFPTAIGNPLKKGLDPRIESEDDVITNEDLLQYIVKSVMSVEGDFRQEEIIEQWQTELVKRPKDVSFNLFTLNISCGSGAYMRQLIADIGEKLNTPLVVFKIKRIKVGNYQMEDCVS